MQDPMKEPKPLPAYVVDFIHDLLSRDIHLAEFFIDHNGEKTIFNLIDRRNYALAGKGIHDYIRNYRETITELVGILVAAGIKLPDNISMPEKRTFYGIYPDKERELMCFEVRSNNGSSTMIAMKE